MSSTRLSHHAIHPTPGSTNTSLRSGKRSSTPPRIHMPSASPVLSIAIGTMMALPGVGSRETRSSRPVVNPMWQQIGRPRPRLLDQRQQRVVALVVVVGEAELGWEHGQLQRLRAQAGDAFDFCHRAADVLDRYLVGDDEARWIGRGKVAQHFVEGDGGVVLTLLQVT